MAIFSAYKKKSILKASINQMANARTAEETNRADALYKSAYQGFSDVVKHDLVLAEALYNWGFALLHQAKTKQGDESIKLLKQAVDRFTFCLLVKPDFLGAAIDGGVAYMDLAREKNLDVKDELYDLAKQFFDKSESIQKGSAAYNLACVYGLREQNEACIIALELSRERFSLPDYEDIMDDSDLEKVKNTKWFVDFMEKVASEPESEIENKKTVVYNVEGRIVKEQTRNDKKFPQQEIDGVVYDVEGHIVKKIEEEQTDEKVELVEKLNS